MYIRRVDVEKYGPTSGCPSCQMVMKVSVTSGITATHNDECRTHMGSTHAARSHRSRSTRHNQDTSRRGIRKTQEQRERRMRSAATAHQKRVVINHHQHHRGAMERTKQTVMRRTMTVKSQFNGREQERHRRRRHRTHGTMTIEIAQSC